MTHARVVGIKDGPSDWDVVLSLFEPNPTGGFREISFELYSEEQVIVQRVCVDSIKRIYYLPSLGGDHRIMWFLSGNFSSKDAEFFGSRCDEKKFKAEFNIETRRGFFKF